jgi:hypothetical protein
MNRKELIKKLEIFGYNISDDKKSIIITRPDSKYHIHIFEFKKDFYIEFPPDEQIYEDEKISITYNDYLLFKTIVLTGLAKAITDDIIKKIGYYE